MEVTGRPEFNHLEGCPNTFVTIVYMYAFVSCDHMMIAGWSLTYQINWSEFSLL